MPAGFQRLVPVKKVEDGLRGKLLQETQNASARTNAKWTKFHK
jgi:hypothetical protein